MSNKKTFSKEEISCLLSDLHSYNLNVDNREVYLHSVKESEEPGVEYRMATTFVKNINLLNYIGKSNILVHMQSIGGCWDNGMAIFDVIRLSSSPITILAYSQASSMTGVILQAAHRRILMPNCHFLVHYGSYAMEGTHQSVLSSIERGKIDADKMLRVFANKLLEGSYFKNKNKNLNYVINWLDKQIRQKEDWYMDAQEAVDFGFADGILGEQGFETIGNIRK